MGLNYKDVAGNEVAKKALVLAAAGHHNILISGPAVVRNALAEAVGSILPPLSEKKASETAKLYEQAREEAPAGNGAPVRVARPYISLAGMVGGGRPVRPGEASLAHNGALVLTDLQDFSSAATSMIAAVSEQGESRLVRVDGTRRFPADALLVATAAPCPCGGYGSGGCTCSPGLVARYREQLGGRLMGRFEIGCAATAVTDVAQMLGDDERIDSREMHDQVMAAHEFRAWREARRAAGERSVQKAIAELPDSARTALLEHGTRLNLCANQLACAVSVARTAADVAGRKEISEDDILAALACRLELNDTGRAEVPREFKEAAWSAEREDSRAAGERPDVTEHGEAGQGR